MIGDRFSSSQHESAGKIPVPLCTLSQWADICLFGMSPWLSRWFACFCWYWCGGVENHIFIPTKYWGMLMRKYTGSLSLQRIQKIHEHTCAYLCRFNYSSDPACTCTWKGELGEGRNKSMKPIPAQVCMIPLSHCHNCEMFEKLE